MQNNYNVIDNFLKEEDFLKLKKIMMSSNFPWYFKDSVSDNNSKDGMYFSHTFFDIVQRSQYLNLLEPLLETMDLKSLIRIKGNLYPAEKELKEHDSHVDFTYPHKGMVFSINTCDGFTKLKCGTKIPSVENRALFFSAHEPHNSSVCTNQKARINININYF